MNIILEGPDAVGKTTLSHKLVDKYGFGYNHFPSNDYITHFNALMKDNTVFDRFHIGELVYPEIYNRKPKLNFDDANNIMSQIVANGDLLIIFICSDLNILKKRLIDRGEENYLDEIEEQNMLFSKYAYIFDAFEYDKYYVIDIAKEDSYLKLDNWIETKINDSNINRTYRKVCSDLINNGTLIESNSTTRGSYKELLNYQFTINDLSNEIVTLKSRNISLNYLIGELLWYASGSNKLDFIDKFSKFWNKISDDGKTSNSAYGYILKYKFNFDQIETVIDLLKNDITSRRAVLNFNFPNENMLNTKDEVCTIALQFLVRNNKLNCTSMMRSNDVIFGLSYDLTFFILLQKYIASRLGLEPGTYTHFDTSLHVYEKDFELVKSIADGDLSTIDYKVNFNKLFDKSIFEELVITVEKCWTSREDFNAQLLDKGVLYENSCIKNRS